RNAAAAGADVPDDAGIGQRELAEHDRAHLGLRNETLPRREATLGPAPFERRRRRDRLAVAVEEHNDPPRVEGTAASLAQARDVDTLVGLAEVRAHRGA